MKKTALIFSVIVVLAVTAALSAEPPPAKSGDSHLGTWQLVSSKYGDAADFSDSPKDRQHLKLLTATHFTWVDYDTKTGKIASAAGGPYSLREGVYIETIEFVGDGMETYLGKKQEFAIKIDGDKLVQSGKLSDGLKIEEVWRRVK